MAFGCEQLGGVDWGPFDGAAALAAVEVALNCGIRLFDTADIYGLGLSERRLADILRPRRPDVVIATKFGLNWRQQEASQRAQTFRDSSRRRVREALEGSLRRLGVDSIDLYQVHWPDPSTPIAETLDELERCRREGKIVHIGLCNFPVALLREACGVTAIASAQVPYSLLDRSAEVELLPFCADHHVAVVVYGPLAHGLLSGKYDATTRFGIDDRRGRMPAYRGEEFRRNLRIVHDVKAVAERYGKSPSQIALRWVLRNPAVTCAIVGCKTQQQVSENADVFDWDLSDEDYAQLSQCSRKCEE
jgi:aryl-alcohol dehydrogenase-like predicted oxidoreductase